MKLYQQYYLLLLLGLSSCGDLAKRIEIKEIVEQYNLGEIDEAKASVESYLSAHQDNEHAWILLGHIQEDLQEDSLARMAYEKALEIKPESEEALTRMGILERKEGDYPKAAEYYKQAIKINPDYAPAYSSLVAIKLKEMKFDEAVALGEKGYALDKKDPVIAANLSIAYHYQGDLQKRDELFVVAEDLGYPNTETLKLIYQGELTILD